jgi:hypothetical protein
VVYVGMGDEDEAEVGGLAAELVEVGENRFGLVGHSAVYQGQTVGVKAEVDVAAACFDPVQIRVYFHISIVPT